MTTTTHPRRSWPIQPIADLATMVPGPLQQLRLRSDRKGRCALVKQHSLRGNGRREGAPS